MRKKRCIVARACLSFVGWLAWTLAPTAAAEPLLLQPATNIYAGAVPLATGTYAIPCVTDWNGDGKKDLLVGYRTADKIALYLNAGEDASPAFTNWSNLQAGGQDIYVPGQASCGAPAPWVCDFDGNGARDLLVGSGSNGKVYFFRNLNPDTNTVPILAAGAPLMVGANELSVTNRATPYVHDWDGDGTNDLLCGNIDGWVLFFKNTNTCSSPIYAPGVHLRAGGASLRFDTRSIVRSFDWDGDGLKDLIASSSAGVYWCRNTNLNSAPVLQAAVALQAPVAGLGLRSINTSGRMRLDLADWNSDGTMDLLLGNADGTVCWFEGYRFAIERIAPLAADQVLVQWRSAPYLRYHVWVGNSLTNLSSAITSNLASSGRLTGWTNSILPGKRFHRVQIAP